MSTDAKNLFEAFDRGVISRRHLLQALGIAVVMRPVAALPQGQCGGANKGTPGCETTPAKLPFEPTGWKTEMLDHFTCQVADYAKEAAFYQSLMNWKIRSDDGKQAVLDIGDWGGLVLRGGYVAPPPPATPPGATGATGAGAGRGGGAPRGPRNAAFDGMAWGIGEWDAKKVEAALKARGLSPVADNHGDYQSFHVKDPDGFDVWITNGTRKNRRTSPAAGKTSSPAPFESTNWKTVWLDHISFEASNYKESAAFYHALLGWKLGEDEGSQNTVEISDIGNTIIRRGNRPGQPVPAVRRAAMGHISFGIASFDPDKVKEELTKRGLNAREDTGGRGDIHTAPYKSYHTTTPNGFDLQISATTKDTRNA